MNKHAWLTTLALACAGPVLAQTAPPPASRPPADVEARFKAADQDHDGTLDKTEAAAMPGLARKFDAVGTDRDGTGYPDSSTRARYQEVNARRQ